MLSKNSFLIRFRSFEREYSLPLIGTLVFLLVLFGSIAFRHFEQASLGGIFSSGSKGGKEFAGLLSKDQSDEFSIKEDEDNEPEQAANEPDTQSVNQDNAGGTSSGGNGGGGNPSPSAPFSSSIASFRQTNAQLNCSVPNFNANKCSKLYTFEAVIRTVNGPGAVSYSWLSNAGGAPADRSFSVAGGEIFTTINKQVDINCKSPGIYTLQLRLNSPTFDLSNTITMTHLCP